MTTKRTLAVLLLSVLLDASCVTRTERVPYYPYAPREDESVLEELRRELGWQKARSGAPGEPFYKRAARGVKETVSGWFRQEETPMSAQEVEEARRRFEQERQEAFRRLRERQEQDKD
ncbi:MAG: hypothetical protein HYZ72_07885 [Deltaproteobacteria bacterium]|nr:hypothetical protein [Deltaproteobacteria bacterium]